VSTSEGSRAVIAALLANLGIAVSKFVAFFFTGSSSMLSESMHSIADSGNQVLLLVGRKRARRRATEEHPFGYGRSRYVYAFIVSIVLFSLGGVFALYEGWHKIATRSSEQSGMGLLRPHRSDDARGIFTAHRDKGIQPCPAWRPMEPFRPRSESPELPVVLLEDIGALVGLIFALAGVTIAVITGDARWDGIGSLAIGGLLVVIAIFLAREMNSLLIGESGTAEHVAAIRRALEGGDDVHRIIHLKTLHLGRTSSW